MSDLNDRDLFQQVINTPESGEFISSRAEVIAYGDGYFIAVITDDHEGHVMFTLPCAREVYKALGEAIEVSDKHRKSAALSTVGDDK